jgi:hypothetical protein
MSAREKACAAINLVFAATTPKKRKRWMKEWLKERQNTLIQIYCKKFRHLKLMVFKITSE